MKSAVALVIAIVLAGTSGFAEGANLGDLGQNGTAENPWVISSLADFQAFCSNSGYWSGYTRLESDIDLGSAGTYSQAPIAGDTDTDSSFDGTEFSGSFDGNGHVISNLTVSEAYYSSLFGKLGTGAEVKNLGLENVSITGTGNYAGGLAGLNDGSIMNCYSSGTVSGDDYIGGLAGYNNSGSITSCHSAGMVSGNFQIGGLAGQNAGQINKSHSTAIANGDDFVGGLVGHNIGTITRCYSTGAANGDDDSIGGLVGYNLNGSITSSYSSGKVIGDANIGGLVGNNNGDVSCSYSTGAVDGRYAVSGLIGYLYNGSITHCYATGKIIGNDYVGGLVGKFYSGSVSDSFWDVETCVLGVSGDNNFGAIGKTTAQMQDISTFLIAGWDFDINDGDMEDWLMDPDSYPKLYWQKPCMYILAGDLNQDCVIDLADLAVIAGNWLINCIDDPTNGACIPY
ncbi:MAG: hypothetical protein K9M75_10410 [Phycisphaerae bacterium]|nr:hypothetical protein [Phycisphaerae bacterium]